MNNNYSLLLILLLFYFSGYTQNANDCTNAILLCGSTPVGIEPDGMGFDEFSLPGNFTPPCYSFNNQTAWFKVEVDQTGNLGFDIIPNNGLDDYDFAVYGPIIDCANLGNSIRCSSTNPEAANVSANTGLNATEVDLTEGPGQAGNGYLRQLDVNRGETYYILIDRAEGSSGFEISINGTASLPQPPGYNTPKNLETCDDDGTADGLHTFNLASQSLDILRGFPDSDVSYHANLGDANLNKNPLPNSYRNSQPTETIYARISSKTGPCSDIASFMLKVNRLPDYENPIALFICNAPTVQSYDLRALETRILKNQSDRLVAFYRSAIEATLNQNAIERIDVPLSGAEVFFRINNTNTGCTIFDSFSISYENGPSIRQPTPIFACRDDKEFLTFELSPKKTEALNGQDPNDFETCFYESPSNRSQDFDRLPLSWESEARSKTIYFKVINTLTGCATDGIFAINVEESPEFEFPETQYLCLNDPNPLQLSIAGPFTYYEWSTGEAGANSSSIFVNDVGTYSVTAYNAAGCSTTKTTEVLASEIATITSINVTGLNYPQNKATINISGAGTYEYTIDQGLYRKENSFSGLSAGYHTISVRDINGCGIVSSGRFLVLDYPRFFTPNGDGIHDTWQLIGLEKYPEAVLYIYNRYGKLLKQINAKSTGWDGTYLDKLLNTDDYWFKLLLPAENISVTGHFSLVN